MDEGNAGGRVVADAAHFMDEGRVPQRLHGDVGEVNVGRLALDVLALPGLAAARLPQLGVGAGATVAGDEMDRLLGAELLMQGPDEVDQLGVHRGGLIGPPVPHEMVELLESVLVVFPVTLIGDGEGLFGVDFVEGEGAGVGKSGALRGQGEACGRKEKSSAKHGATCTDPPDAHPRLPRLPSPASWASFPRDARPFGLWRRRPAFPRRPLSKTTQ